MEIFQKYSGDILGIRLFHSVEDSSFLHNRLDVNISKTLNLQRLLQHIVWSIKPPVQLEQRGKKRNEGSLEGSYAIPVDAGGNDIRFDSFSLKLHRGKTYWQWLDGIPIRAKTARGLKPKLRTRGLATSRANAMRSFSVKPVWREFNLNSSDRPGTLTKLILTEAKWGRSI